MDGRGSPLRSTAASTTSLPLMAQSLRFIPAQPAAWLLGALMLLLTAMPGMAASQLLDSIKQNPQQARELCSALRSLNGRGYRALSSEGIALVASRQRLSQMDAEIVTTYVVGLYCPDVL
jgi:hypothetical protein